MRRIVGIGELHVVNSPTILIGRALGSCVGLIVYDETGGVGGMAHIMLPTSTEGPAHGMPAKFADRAIPLMLDRIEKLGGRVAPSQAKLTGGARMFHWETAVGSDIGARNIEAVKMILNKVGIPIVAEDVGGDYARTVEFDAGSFKVSIKSIGHEQRRI